uniref:INO80 complex subunit E n=1 Tax=Chelydra serpentina TaxID=8475 RepID=A0A8C3SMJ2_CHESE
IGIVIGSLKHFHCYRALMRRLKLLIYEQECFQEELRKAQRTLLKVSWDKSFLLDRLLQYEHVEEESSDSEATASSENSDGEGPKGAEPQTLKRKRSPQLGGASSPSSSGLSLQATSGFPLQGSGAPSPYLSSLASPPLQPVPLRVPGGGWWGVSPSPRPGGALWPPSPPSSRPPTILSTVPQQMFSNAGEGSGEDPLDGDGELVIDIPE